MANTYQNLKQQAYNFGSKFLSTNYSEEIIRVKLEKQGFSEVISKEVATNIVIQRNESGKKESFNYKKFGIIVTSICAVLTSIIFISTGEVFQSLGFFVTSIGSIFLIHSMTTHR